MGKATLINSDLDWEGEARLYRLDPPLAYYSGEDGTLTTDYVTVCGYVDRRTGHHGTQTFILPTDAEGKVIDWRKVDGSFTGTADTKSLAVSL